LTDLKPIVLKGYGLRLEPVNLVHAAGLREAACNNDLSNRQITPTPEPDQINALIETGLTGLATGRCIVWVIIEQSTNRTLGACKFQDILPAIDRVEIGNTWLRHSEQQRFINAACQLLMMQHAFEILGCKAVGWRTDIFDFASQTTIERLGAKRDGVLRHHTLRRDLTVCDMVIYSVLLSEWAKTKKNLLAQLSKKRDSGHADIELVAITKDNIDSILILDAGANGARMTAKNAESIAQACFNQNARQFGVQIPEQGDEAAALIGYLLLWDPSLQEKTKLTIDQLYVWGLMIDFKYQRLGYGAQVLRKVQSMAIEMPNISKVSLSHQLLEHNPKPFYEALGFTEVAVTQGERAHMVWKVPT
jgi:N-acetyltransferase